MRFALAVASKRCFAAALALALLAGTAPLNALKTQPGCAMACCAGRSALMGCANGCCRAKLSKKRAVATREILCDARRAQFNDSLSATQLVRLTFDEAANAHSHDEAQQMIERRAPASVAVSLMTRPCPPECGAASFGFSASRRMKDSAALAHSLRPRPPTRKAIRNFAPTFSFVADCARTLTPPRAPPSPFNSKFNA